MIASLLFIMFGMGLVAVNEISFNVEGFIWAAAGVLCSSCAQIFFSPLQKELNLDALQMLFHLSPILTIGSFATIPLFENVTELIRFDINSKVVIDIGMSCCMAVLLNTSNYLGMCMHWTHLTNPRDDLVTAVNTNLNPFVSFPYLQF